MSLEHISPIEKRWLYTRQWWLKQKQLARSLASERAARGARDSLIAVAAQHPSIEGIYPNEEYRLRLETAIAIDERTRLHGDETAICLLGSRLIDEKSGIADKVSLADMGLAYLTVRGVPQSRLIIEWNRQYKGKEGVYNGADEAFVAASAFRDNPNFGQLIMVASPGQVARYRLNFLANGVNPHFEIPSDTCLLPDLYHSSSIMRSALMAYTYLINPDWQGSSTIGKKSRRERQPEDGIESKIPLANLVEIYREKY